MFEKCECFETKTFLSTQGTDRNSLSGLTNMIIA